LPVTVNVDVPTDTGLTESWNEEIVAGVTLNVALVTPVRPVADAVSV